MLNRDWVPRVLLRWWWRLREADTGIASGDTFGSPNYKYGKVGKSLRVVSETVETPYVCCGYCSAHMAARTADSSVGERMQDEAHEIRSAGGRSHNNGNNAQELRDGAIEAVGVTLSAIAVDEIPDRLRAGYACTAGLQYAKLPDYLKIQNNDFGHAVCLYGWKDDGGEFIGFYDPLWPQDADGAWAKWSDVKRALWGDGNHSTTVAIAHTASGWGYAAWGSSAWA
jgi:hypothetical protein